MWMADESNFTPDEWKLLLESVTMAGIAISAADPSGHEGLDERLRGGVRFGCHQCRTLREAFFHARDYYSSLVGLHTHQGGKYG
jgi:hypothetical protein